MVGSASYNQSTLGQAQLVCCGTTTRGIGGCGQQGVPPASFRTWWMELGGLFAAGLEPFTFGVSQHG
jgi:hypothetical protein